MYDKKFVSHFISFLLMFVSMFFASLAYSQTLISLEPDAGTVGKLIRINGTGFPATGLTVFFRSTTDTAYHSRRDIDSPDGRTILYAIPSHLRLTCHYDDPPCAAPLLGVSPGTFEIYVRNGSTDSNSLIFTVTPSNMMGDVNGDTFIDIIDALLTAQYYVGLNPAPFYPEVADVNVDGAIDIIDALLIAQYYVGLITEFPGQTQGDVEIVGSSMPRNMDPQPEAGDLDSVAQGNNMFAFDCFQTIRGESGNIFFSPISISFAFAMCYAGANGNTEAEIASTMHFTLPEERLHNAFNALEIILTSDPVDPPPDAGDELILNIANSTWGQKDYYFVPAFLDILAINYGAAMNTVDFIADPDNCRLLINDWVSNETGNRINDLLPPGSVNVQTRLVLTNAIYFKANWLYPFDVADTTTGPFHLLDNSTTIVPMMYDSKRILYCEVPGEYCAVKLPYQGVKRNSMIIILPDQGQYEAFENSFTYAKFNEIYSSLSDYIVNLTMPKYTYEWEKSLKSTLQALGMTDAFVDTLADFSGITDEEDLYISDAFHKSFVAVDEKGTEASAATAIVVGTPSMPPIVDMTIDRPFLFVIYNHDTDTILFLGRVLEP